MPPLVVFALSMLIPFGMLGLLLWLSWLEDTLDDAVRRTERRRVPSPVLALSSTTAAEPVVPPAAGSGDPVPAAAIVPEPETPPAAMPAAS